MKYLSVCSGIEAATVAWHGLGWEPVAFAEIEAFPAAVLAQHYPTVPNLSDLTKYREWPEELLAEVDLLVGGTPCQAFSVAGQRRSLDDERGNLSLVYVNLYHHINEVRKRHGRPPAIALWENVPGVLSTKDNAFCCFIGGLLGCDEAPATESGKWDKAGFLSSETVRVGYRVLDAQYFGVAQRRRRVFLAAVPCELVERFGERACPSEILSLRESVLGNPPTRGAAREVAPTVPARCTAGGGLGTDFDCDGGVIEQVAKPLGAHALSKGRGSDLDNTTYIPYDLFQITAPVNRQNRTPESPCHTLAKDNAAHASVVAFTQNSRDEVRQISGEGSVAGALSAEAGMHQTNYLAFAQNQLGEVRVNPDVMGTVNQSQNASGRNTPMVCAIQERAICENPDAGPDGAGVRDDGVSYTLEARTVTQAVAFANRTRDGIKVPEVMKDGVVPALTNPGNGGRADAVNVAAAMQVRRLCPSECEALQGFPIGYTDVHYRKKPAADGPRYRALGNSMAVPCMWWLGHRIHQATR